MNINLSDKQKKGAIVIGNSSTLLLQENGDLIDQFETVIRLNSYITEGYEKYVGTKTDIWVRAKNHEIEYRDGRQFSEVWLKPGWNKGNINGRVTSHIGIPVYNSSESTIIDLPASNFTGRSWTTGFCAIKFAIERFENVTVTGFNFYSNIVEGSKTIFRPHYYRSEAPAGYATALNLTGLGTLKSGKYNRHNVGKEREEVIKLYKNKNLNLLNTDEIIDPIKCNEMLDQKNLKPCFRYIPKHLIELYKAKGCSFFGVENEFDIEKTIREAKHA